MAPIKLISSDFDGTLIGHGSDGRCSEVLSKALELHRERGGLWAVNTGRSLFHAVEGLRRFSGPVEPDFLLTNEREVYRWDGRDAWIEHGDWNEVCRTRHDELFDKATEVFAVIESMAKRSSGITVLYEGNKPVGIVTESEAIMETLCREIDTAAAHFGEFGYQRNTIYLRFCHSDYHKGSALGELCRLENIHAADVFAVGDHYNDIPMLDGKYAVMTACPANAIDEVKQIVKAANGFIAAGSWAEGVAEALLHYEKTPRSVERGVVIADY